MRKRALWGPLAALAALYALRMAFRMSQDIGRYNRMLAMSDEGPLSQKMPGLVNDVVREERGMVKEWLNLFTSFPGELARYFRMESM